MSNNENLMNIKMLRKQKFNIGDRVKVVGEYAPDCRGETYRVRGVEYVLRWGLFRYSIVCEQDGSIATDFREHDLQKIKERENDNNNTAD